MSAFIKICGLRDAGDVQAATDAGANAVGFVFAESVRRVTPTQAKAATEGLPSGVRKVAVTRYRTEQRSYEEAFMVRVPKIETRVTTEAYQVRVPYEEQRNYTVQVPVTKTRATMQTEYVKVCSCW